ncbi:MAG: ABC transporter ATP-binding protein [Microbacterium sp.]
MPPPLNWKTWMQTENRPARAGIDVVGVSKSYGPVRVLSDVSFSCPLGSVTGLLGPNGSGKSTVMRIMLALAHADDGVVVYDGHEYRELRVPSQYVGAMIDPAAHHSGRSVAETLAGAAILADVPLSRSREVMDLLGLGSVRRRRFGALSLGMKQRVGLAIALIGRPKYLILDEPMNGLDIESSDWLRDTLTSHARDGGAVLLSTHLLQELQGFADRLVVLSQGRVTFSGGVDDSPPEHALVRVPEPDLLRLSLDRRGIDYTWEQTSLHFRVRAHPLAIGRILLEDAILVEELVWERESIRDTYMRLTQGEYVAGRSA